MSKYLIRFATLQDVDDIMDFIRLHWRSDHVLATNKSFFLYEYQDGNDINFVIGIDTTTQQIVGVCGFIKNSRDREGSDIWGSLWKVIKTDNPALGIQILEFIPENTKCRTFSSLGIAPRTLPIYDFLKYKTNKLKHFYRLKDKVSYQVAGISEKKIVPFLADKNYSLRRLSNPEEISEKVFENRDRLPYKDRWYMEKRYFKHPEYSYQIYVIDDGSEDSLLVAREVNCFETKLLRIVDFIGDAGKLAHLGRSFQQWLDLEDYEYIDFYCFGIDDEILRYAGFQLREESDSNIIPNYFEPFVLKNVELYFFNNIKADRFYIFKGDGDQDRPNWLHKHL